MNVLDEIVQDQLRTDLPEIQTGDTVKVSARVVEDLAVLGGDQRGQVVAAGVDQFAQAAQTQGASAQLVASTKRALAQSTYNDALATLRRVAKLRPQAADVQLQIAGAAETALTGLQDVSFVKPEIAVAPLDRLQQLRA